MGTWQNGYHGQLGISKALLGPSEKVDTGLSPSPEYYISV